MYSCALWSENEGGVRGDLEMGPTPGDLESAQIRKLHHVLRAARVKPGDRILEFGSGWGGLAIEVSYISIASLQNTHQRYLGGPIFWLRGRHFDFVGGTEKACRGTRCGCRL